MADKHFNNDSYTQKDTEKGKNRGEFWERTECLVKKN
jgi:hypothetical protein